MLKPSLSYYEPSAPPYCEPSAPPEPQTCYYEFPPIAPPIYEEIFKKKSFIEKVFCCFSSK